MEVFIKLSDAVKTLKSMAVPLVKDPVCLNIWERDRTLDNAIDALRKLPSVDADLSGFCDKLWRSAYERGKQEAQQWISCEERLPELGEEVLVCYDFKGHRSVLIGCLYGDGKFHGYDDEYLTVDGRKHRKAVAWMPLPEPYKGEQE